MVAVSWSFGVCRNPLLYPHRGGEDVEALVAISKFLSCYAVDLTGTLEWPWATRRLFAIDQHIDSLSPAECLDIRAREVLDKTQGKVSVLCAGDIDSTAVAAALLKHADDPSLITVHCTESSVATYPDLFERILPAYGVAFSFRDGKPLVGTPAVAFVDGRSGDDWQGAYQAKSKLFQYGESFTGELSSFVTLIAQEVGPKQQNIDAAERGIWRFINNAPFVITDRWSLFITLYRVFMTQWDAIIGSVVEPDSAAAFDVRLPFFDAPIFSCATQYLIGEGAPSVEQESLHLRRYVADVFGNDGWAKQARPCGKYYIYDPRRFFTLWYDENMQARSFSDFPWKGTT